MIHTFIELLAHLANTKYRHINNFINDENDRWSGAEKLESLFRLLSTFGFISKISDYHPTTGNFNNKTIKKLENTHQIFYDDKGRPRYLNDGGDASDYTAIHRENEKNLLVTTVKNKKVKNMSVQGMETSKIEDVYVNKYQDEGYKHTYCIVVPDKADLEKKTANCNKTSDIWSDRLQDKDTIVIDSDDVNEGYYRFREHIQHQDIMDFIHMDIKPHIPLMHQELGAEKTLHLKSMGVVNVLWGHIQRSGKSHLMCEVIIKDSIGKPTSNYLILTTAPNETISQYVNALLCSQLKMVGFNTHVLDGNNKTPILDNRNIIICSKHFLQNKIGKTEHTSNIEWLRAMKFDMRFMDEGHHGGTTTLAKKTLRFYGNDVFTVHLSATFSKIAAHYNIPQIHHILWDVDDIHICKHISDSNFEESMEKLEQKHGPYVRDIIKKYSLRNIREEYQKCVELRILTSNLTDEAVDEIQTDTQNTLHGLSIEGTLLLIANAKSVRTVFQNEDAVIDLLYRIFGKYSKLKVPDPAYPESQVMMNRIKNICDDPSNPSRCSIGTKADPSIILVFLPPNHIDECSIALEELIRRYNILPDYDIISINSKKTSNPKQTVEDAFTTTVSSKTKKGLVVLSGRQCSLGVSLPKCDIVILLNTTISPDLISQMMYRAATVSENKKIGFVIDMDIHRAVRTVTNYAMRIHPGHHPRDAVKHLLKGHQITLNQDYWCPGVSDLDTKLNKMVQSMYNVYTSKMHLVLETLTHRIRQKYVELPPEHQHILQRFRTNNRKQQPNKNTTPDLAPPADINKGIERIPIEGGCSTENTTAEQEDAPPDETPRASYMEIISQLAPRCCLLTIMYPDVDLLTEMYRIVTETTNLRNILIDQCKMFWGDTISIIDINNVFDIYISTGMNTDPEFRQIVRLIKELFVEHREHGKELTELINKYLIPNQVEKEDGAEWSTPYVLCNDLLDLVPSEFWTVHTNKILEPCAGKGAILMAIISKFMDGLQEWEPDAKKRYTWIVTKCIYFADFNSTNIFICKLLIDPNQEYIDEDGNSTLNIWEGDTMKLDIKETWGVDKFDAVIGNPPFQPPSNNKKGGKSMWPEFVRFSLNVLRERGYLLFIHPSLWRKPENKLRSVMFNRQIHYLSIHNKVEGKKMFGAVTRYEYYLLENVEPYMDTIVDFEDGKTCTLTINNDLPFIPNYGWSIIRKVMDKVEDDNGIMVIRDSDCHTSRTYVSRHIKHEYKLLNSISKTKGKTFCYSSKPHKNQTHAKVIFSNGETIVPFYDNGDLGVTEGGLYSLVDSEQEGQALINYLNTSLIKFIIKATKWSNFETVKQIFQYIPKMIDTSVPITDANVYEYFDLSSDEIKQIEDVV
jgi:hypothetical protein